jgi:hypothetical protein
LVVAPDAAWVSASQDAKILVCIICRYVLGRDTMKLKFLSQQGSGAERCGGSLSMVGIIGLALHVPGLSTINPCPKGTGII